MLTSPASFAINSSASACSDAEEGPLPAPIEAYRAAASSWSVRALTSSVRTLPMSSS